MARTLPLFLCLAALGCGAPAPSPVDNAVAGAALPPEGDDAQANQTDPAVAQRRGTVGPFSFTWDPAQLARTEAEILIPPDWQRKVRGVKLVARERADLIGKAECMYGQSGQASTCTAAKEAGLGFVFVETPFEELRASISDPPPSPVNLGGREGIRWEIGAEGEGADYILLPAEGGTVLITHQDRADGNPDERAVQAVLDSLRPAGG